LKTLLLDQIVPAAELLRAGQLVIFPTETVYGLGADATNPEAVAAVFRAKKRPADNPLIVHIWSLAQVDELAQHVPAYARALIAAFFPGPFTILLPKRPLIPDITTAGSPYVCLRMPSLPLARQLLEATGRPIAAPSANLSGSPSPTRWQDCLEDMNGRVAAILKGPEAQHGLESTIVDATGPHPILLRPGAISLEQLAALTPDIQSHPGQHTTVTPGMKYRHYAPKARVQLIVPGETPTQAGLNVAYLGLTPPAFETGYTYLASSLEDYAHQLFAFFRECDRRGLDYIYAEPVEQHGLGRAIMNRLAKAVAPG
jgi:L-threonylcarbamoyladenylate synthase